MEKEKKFKNIHRDKQHKFLKSLKQYNFSKQAINVIDVTTNNNIIVRIFNTLLRYKRINFHDYLSYTYLIKMYVTEMLTTLNSVKNYQQINKDIDVLISESYQEIEQIKIKQVNYEKRYLKQFKFSEQEINSYLNYNEYYGSLAKVFASPFKDEQNDMYEFAYLLAMYINLDLYFNQYNIPENYNMFTLKLKVQQDMFQVISDIIPHNYNEIIISLNKWLNKYEKKFNSKIYRKLKD